MRRGFLLSGIRLLNVLPCTAPIQHPLKNVLLGKFNNASKLYWIYTIGKLDTIETFPKADLRTYTSAARYRYTKRAAKKKCQVIGPTFIQNSILNDLLILYTFARKGP